MKLHDYLLRPDALSTSELAKEVGVKDPAQVRQWRHGYGNRRPGPENCVDIERVTGGLVRRWDLRPDDWHRIWPELIGAEGAPDVPAAEAHAQQAA